VSRRQSVGNLALAGYDDIFSVRQTNNGECVEDIPLAELHPPEFHPFQVNDDDAMYRLAESVKQYGVGEPGLAWIRADGGYSYYAVTAYSS